MTISRKPVLSVIIGIRDWEVDRLAVAIRSHLNSTMVDDVEIVISDYGSKNRDEVKALATNLGCVYVYTGSKIWSRSRALNVGIVASRGEFILATDADIIFSPETHSITVELLRRFPGSLQLKQCRDLPERISISQLDTFDWPALDRIARTRPRWGMGGLAACSRKTADLVRGYDERMVIWGAEDNDFGKRVRASGGTLNWIDDDRAQIFHVWHPPFMQTHPDADQIFQKNLRYLNNDPSFVRNLNPDAIYKGHDPLVSVVIATRNRADYLKASMSSVFEQSFRDFELIVIDDGSEDHTMDVLEECSDPRLRILRSEQSLGVGGARNIANREARGHYIAVHDDDDLMMPERLERQLGCLTEGTQGAYGGWVDFSLKNFDLSYRPGKEPCNLETVCFSGGVFLHPTLLLEKRLFERFPYYSGFKAGSDYNVALRLLWNGAILKHCQSYVTLRRLHSRNMTAVSSQTQKASSRVTNSALLNQFAASFEQDLRQKGNLAREAKIGLSKENRVQISKLLPELKIRCLTERQPKTINSYRETAKSVLIGQFQKGSFHLLKEILVSKEDGIPNNDASVQFVCSKNELELTSGDNLVETLRHEAASSFFSKKSDWVILDAGLSGKIKRTLDKCGPFVPEKEDVVIFYAANRWFLAFESAPSHRSQIIQRKIDLSGTGIGIFSIKEKLNEG